MGKFLYLTTVGRTSGEPREIEIWFTEREGRFYVIAEYKTSHWVQNLLANPRVRWRVDGRDFRGVARVLADGPEHDAVQQLSREKYGRGDGLVVELSPA